MIKEIRDKCPGDYFDLIESFDNSMSNFSFDVKTMVTIRIPVVLKAIFEHRTGETIEEVICHSCYNGKITIFKDKLRISSDLLLKFLDSSINYVVGVFEELFRKPEIKHKSTLMAVGVGFKSSVVIKAMIQRFPNLTVIVPKDPDLVVLKGAVMYGFDPEITTRVVCINAFYQFDKIVTYVDLR